MEMTLNIRKGWKKLPTLLCFGTTMLLASCMSMPTPTSQITGMYAPEGTYADYNCGQLASEISSLARRENQLIIAQEQRIKTS